MSNLVPVAKKAKTKEELSRLMAPVSARCEPQKVLENAALVAFELEKIGARMIFGWAMMEQTEDGKALKQGMSQDWVDTLGDFPIAEVKRAIGDCLTDAPKQAPHEHAVKAAINARRGKAMATAPRISKQSEPEPSAPISDEEREKRKAFAESVLSGYRETENEL